MPSPDRIAARSRILRNIVLFVGSLCLGTIGLIFLVLNSGAEYYKHVDELARDLAVPSFKKNRVLRVHGFVTLGSHQKVLDPVLQTWTHRFSIENCAAALPVEYSGILPDTFRDGAEVVIKGKLDVTTTKTTLHASEVTGKCPSKYAQSEEHLQAQASRCIKEQKG